MAFTAPSTFSKFSLKDSSSIGLPSTTIRSLILTRWGEVKSPVRFSSERSIPSRYAHTEPFPLVPATWITFRPSCGSPRYFRKVFVCTASFFFVNLGISSIYFTASSYVILPVLLPALQTPDVRSAALPDLLEARSGFHCYIRMSSTP